MDTQPRSAVEETSRRDTKNEKRTKRQGKGSKAKARDRLRERENQQDQALISAWIKKLAVVDDEESGTIVETIDRMVKPPVKRAVQLSASFRGVGFACAIMYERSTSTWNQAVIHEIMTIHQLYRVGLWMTYLKLFLAHQEQTEPRMEGLLIRMSLPGDIKSQLMTIMDVPAVFTTILDSIGKIVTPQAVYHMGLPDVAADELSRSLLLTPLNMRATVQFLADDNLAHENARIDFIAHNSIPGARFANNQLQNPDEVWPADAATPESVSADVHAYKDWVNRVRHRLPKNFFSRIDWSGKANCSGLWSTERLDISLVSTFTEVPAQPSRKLPARGRVPARVLPAIPASAQYSGFNVSGVRENTFWACEGTNDVSALVGCASLVGENCTTVPRLEEMGVSAVCYNPVLTMRNICDAP